MRPLICLQFPQQVEMQRIGLAPRRIACAHRARNARSWPATWPRGKTPSRPSEMRDAGVGGHEQRRGRAKLPPSRSISAKSPSSRPSGQCPRFRFRGVRQEVARPGLSAPARYWWRRPGFRRAGDGHRAEFVGIEAGQIGLDRMFEPVEHVVGRPHPGDQPAVRLVKRLAGARHHVSEHVDEAQRLARRGAQGDDRAFRAPRGRDRAAARDRPSFARRKQPFQHPRRRASSSGKNTSAARD